MPKVLLTQQARDNDAAAAADEALRLTVLSRMRRDRISQVEIAKRIGLTAPTMSRRLSKPETFTLGELRRLISTLGMTETEAGRCI